MKDDNLVCEHNWTRIPNNLAHTGKQPRTLKVILPVYKELKEQPNYHKVGAAT